MTSQTNPNYPKNIQRVVDAVLTQGRASTNALRATMMNYTIALSNGQSVAAALPAAWQHYIETLTKYAYRITDAQVTQLKASGHREEEIFELTIAAALGAGLARLERGLAAIDDAYGRQQS